MLWRASRFALVDQVTRLKDQMHEALEERDEAREKTSATPNTTTLSTKP